MNKVNVDDSILLYAFRYSLSRESNAPIAVMDAIIHNLEKISKVNIEKIIEEIESHTNFKLKFHEELWFSLVSDLKFEIKIRELRN